MPSKCVLGLRAAAWVAGDETYGRDEGLRRRRRPYVLVVERSGRLLGVVDGVPTRMGTEPLAPDAYAQERVTVGTGSEGSRVYEWMRSRLPRKTTAEWALWLLIRRPVSLSKREHVYYRAYDPEKTPLAELAQVAATPLAVEEGFERASADAHITGGSGRDLSGLPA